MNTINPIILELLHKRGISGESEILEFLSDKPQKTYDPFLLHDLEAGVDFILSAINEKKKICIYGDYDADGITSVSILLQFFKNFDVPVSYYVPSRFEEGYGLNKNAITKLKETGIDVIITVDCGSVSYEEVEHAKALGLGIIVTDHHSITDTVADCLLINPKHPDCNYPFKFLAGCGVAFKLAQGIQRKAGLPKKNINELLDLVAIGTIGDIVPLVDENRTLVKYGMGVLRQGNRQGLNRLMEAISLKKESIKSDSIAFGIVPHINAAGRMLDAKIGVELMIESNATELQRIVNELISNNQQRKKVQEDTFQECEKILMEAHMEDFFFIVDNPKAHEGISGIVAGKLKDKYHKPTVILTPSEEGYLKGTGRSIKKINLYNILKEHECLFQRFGGHAGACGFLMKQEHLSDFRKGIQQSVGAMLETDSSLFDDEAEIDLYLEGKDVTLTFVKEMDKLAPFGNSNEKPYIAIENAAIKKVQVMGSQGNHARFLIDCVDGANIQGVLFNKAVEYAQKLNCGQNVTLMGHLDISEWNGVLKVQLLVSDIL